jgi:hypothetical protein
MKMVMFYIPDEMDDVLARASAVEAIGWELHNAELERMVVNVFNLGWGVSASELEISIASKTDQGVLTTNFDSERGHVSHTWSKG